MRSEPASPLAASPHPGLGFTQFVVLMAAMMALSALAIDSMLPALPAISQALGFAEANRRQWVLTAYILGFGVSQIFYGTLADRYGRRPVLLVGLVLYVLFSLGAAFAYSFESIVIARVLQGVGAAATRVVPMSIIRDCYAGRQMARVMSFISIVFMAVPIMAPSVGQTIIWFLPWQWEFGMLAVMAALALVWAIFRLPETQHPEDRVMIEFRQVAHAFARVLENRLGMAYALAGTFTFGSILGFINSAQQIFADVYHALDIFPEIFACVAGAIAVSSFVNARLVARLGMRVISHAALLAFIAISALDVVVALSGHETLLVFALFQGAVMFCFGLVSGNFNAMAMEDLGHVAGTASSVQGSISMVGGALIGIFIGQHFDGTVVPLACGYLATGLLTLGATLYAERGRLFVAHDEGTTVLRTCPEQG